MCAAGPSVRFHGRVHAFDGYFKTYLKDLLERVAASFAAGALSGLGIHRAFAGGGRRPQVTLPGPGRQRSSPLPVFGR